MRSGGVGRVELRFQNGGDTVLGRTAAHDFIEWYPVFREVETS